VVPARVRGGALREHRIKVLVVEDSAVVRELLVHLLNSDPEMTVVGTAHNGEEALEFVKRHKPDVITMDINMPRMNGFEATRKIMETAPAPIVIVSGSWDASEVDTTFRALEAGALTAVARPQGPGHPEHEGTARELIQTVKLMSEVKVVRRWSRVRESGGSGQGESGVSIPPGVKQEARAETEIVSLGASTGGPMVLHAILSQLPKDFPLPVLIVQHMAPGFIQGFAAWLGPVSGIPIKVAGDGEPLQPGHAYLAPDGFQMGVTRDGRIALSRAQAENGLRPSVSYLFRSVAEVYGRRAAAVLLTGMGTDGAAELKALHERGALTIAQDQNTSVVFGMPGEAVRLGAASYVLPPEKIAAALASFASEGRKAGRPADGG